ncbi:MAG TPA: amidase family protein [Blastocatellia bacterium]|nr:amidase family protein [Blastocatellia bacterium]HMV84576.1 amidase family protein [Blastocatellia bacterium]HMX26453.1 amidase family protein [Blastocatellia bacterium]HMY76144.1 amidase family protein [Blastocatellia bacterium]HMZ18149.1 amidase family protein [Blastocatellia bacterium]
MKASLPDSHANAVRKMVWLTVLLLCFSCLATGQTKKFDPIEATIADIHRAMRSGKLTARQLVEAYLKRIDAYDQSTKLNAIVIVNPNALAEADKLDAEFKRTKKLRPLHGIPVIVKDNFDTKDLQTTGGSIALKGSVPPNDAFQVRRIREAGAIILAKSNMDEWAFRPIATESSTAGVTRNPYDLDRVPAGSSGGTAAAVAASFGAVGLGSDTGNSIRGPSSHNALVGIRSTMGLTSRDGIIPLFLRQDIGGPLARTVEDAARILEVIAGYDTADPITKMSEGKIPKSYTQFLKKDGLKGARLGVFRRYLDAPTTDPQIKEVMANALAELKAQGAIIVDPFDLPNYQELTRNISCNSFHYDLNNYLASLGEKAKYKMLAAIVEAKLYLPLNEARLKTYVQTPAPTNNPCRDVYHDPRSIALREALLQAMAKEKLDAIIYPTWSNAPRKLGDLQSPAGDNSQILSPQTGFPAITVPMGFTYGSLPAGITFLGKLFGESELIKYAYAYEQATKHRKPPEKFPPLQH